MALKEPEVSSKLLKEYRQAHKKTFPVIDTGEYTVKVQQSLFKVKWTIVSPYALCRFTYAEEGNTFTSMDDNQLGVYASMMRHQNLVRGVLYNIALDSKTTVIEFGLARHPDHESVLGAMKEAGFDENKLIKAGSSDITLPGFSFSLGGTTEHSNGKNRIDVYTQSVPLPIEADYVIPLARNIATAASRCLTPVARKIFNAWDHDTSTTYALHAINNTILDEFSTYV